MLTVLTQKPLLSTGEPSDLIIFATCSRRRSAARRATNSLYRCAAPITAQSIASATSAHGGRPPMSTRSKPRAVVLIIDTRVGQLFHMTGGVSRITICKRTDLDIKTSIILCLDA